MIEAHAIPNRRTKTSRNDCKRGKLDGECDKRELKEHLEEQGVEVKSKATLPELQELAAETV